MRLSYTVSREEYLSALLYLLRRRNRTPWRRFTAFMLTAGQFLGVLVFSLSGALPWEKAAVLVLLSGLVLVLNLCFYLPTPWRARLLFWRMKRDGQWNPEFEKTHQLTWQEDKLVHQYGKVRQKLAAVSITQLARWRGSLLVMTGEALFCIIPAEAWSEEGAQSFQREVRERKFRQSKEQIQVKRRELEAQGSAPYRYDYPWETYLRDLKRAHRAAYAGRVGWSLSSVLRVCGALLLVVLGWRTPAPLAALVLLYPYIRTFSFLLDRQLTRETEAILSFAPDRAVEFYETESCLVFLGEIHCLEIPREDVLAVQRIGSGVALYLKNRMILPIPDGGSGPRTGKIQGLLKENNM